MPAPTTGLKPLHLRFTNGHCGPGLSERRLPSGQLQALLATGLSSLPAAAAAALELEKPCGVSILTWPCCFWPKPTL